MPKLLYICTIGEYGSRLCWGATCRATYPMNRPMSHKISSVVLVRPHGGYFIFLLKGKKSVPGVSKKWLIGSSQKAQKTLIFDPLNGGENEITSFTDTYKIRLCNLLIFSQLKTLLKKC
jgi:hypothetical protein